MFTCTNCKQTVATEPFADADDAFCGRECARKHARKFWPVIKSDILKDCVDEGLNGEEILKTLISPSGSWHKFYMLAIETPPLLLLPPPTPSSSAKKKATIVNGVLTWV